MSFRAVLAGLICAGALVGTAPAVLAQAQVDNTGSKQWHITARTSFAGQDVITHSLDLCIGASDLRNPPAALTGPVCTSQTYNLEGNTLKWIGTCDSAKGSGSVVFADDGQTFAGDVNVTLNDRPVSTHLNGQLVGMCSKKP